MAAFLGTLSFEEPLSWCLGTDWEVSAVKGAGGASVSLSFHQEGHS